MRTQRLLTLFFLLPAGLVAQEFQGTILGRITDGTSAAVPDLQVRAVAVDASGGSYTSNSGHGIDRRRRASMESASGSLRMMSDR